MKTSPKSIYDERYRRLIAELVKIRQEKNFTQRDLAKKADVSHCFIGRTETYERRLDLIEFFDLCSVLELTQDEVIKLIKTIM